MADDVIVFEELPPRMVHSRAAPDGLFTLSAQIETAEMRQLYEEIVAQLRQEFDQVPTFGTLEQLVLERIAYGYVFMRDKELRNEHWDLKSYKEFMRVWMDMVSRIQTAKNSAKDAERMREDLIATLGAVVRRGVSALPENVRSIVAANMAEDLKTIGL